jgi:hypothetical protein
MPKRSPFLWEKTLSQSPPPGWYQDPSSTRIYRWWDGLAWTKHTSVGQPAATEVPASSANPQVPAAVSTSTQFGAAQVEVETAPQAKPDASWAPSRPNAGQSIRQRNQYALITLGIVAVYLVLAVKTGIVMLGVWPILTSVASWQRKEPLAGLAICGAVVAMLIAIVALTGH